MANELVELERSALEAYRKALAKSTEPTERREAAAMIALSTGVGVLIAAIITTLGQLSPIASATIGAVGTIATAAIAANAHAKRAAVRRRQANHNMQLASLQQLAESHRLCLHEIDRLIDIMTESDDANVRTLAGELLREQIGRMR